MREHLTHRLIVFPLFLKYLTKTGYMILSCQWHIEMHTDEPQQFLLPMGLNLTADIKYTFVWVNRDISLLLQSCFSYREVQ
jgi:hypothetical protein